MTDIHVKKVDLVGIPAIRRGITLFKARDYAAPTNNLAEVRAAFAALDDEGKAEVVAALTEREEDAEANLAKVLAAAGIKTTEQKEFEKMAGSVINLIKAYAAETDASGDRLRASIAKSSVDGLTCEGMFAPPFQRMARQAVKDSRGELTHVQAEAKLAKGGGLGTRLFDLAYGSFSDFDADEHLQRIEKSNPVSLDVLGALIIKEG